MAVGRTPRASVRVRRSADDGSIGTVPYSGATANLDLGAFSLLATSIVVDNATIGSLSGVLQATAGVVSGSAALDDLADVDVAGVSDGEVLAYDVGTGNWIPLDLGAGFVPYTGAVASVDLGAFHSLTASALHIISGFEQIHISGNIISSSISGTISFDDDNLITTGTLTIRGTSTFGTNSDNTFFAANGTMTQNGTARMDSVIFTDDADITMGGTGHITSGSEGFIVGTLTILDGSIDDTDGLIAWGDTDLVSIGDVGIGTATPDTSLQVVGDSKFGDDNTNYATIGTTGDLTFVGTAGLQFGSCSGMEIAWIQANAVQNTWYDISDADFVDGQLHGVTHDGNGQLTVTVAGMYAADWAGSFEADAANVHVQITFSINGTEGDPGMNHIETVAVSREFPCSGLTILDLAANDTVNVSVRTTDASTPDLVVDHLMLRLIQIGGT